MFVQEGCSMSMTEKLAYIKKLRHLTTEEIAQQSGVPLGTLNKIFSGQTKNPAVGPVDKIRSCAFPYTTF